MGVRLEPAGARPAHSQHVEPRHADGAGRYEELGIYVRGALESGVTVDEIREVLLHATVYCGTPASQQATLAAHAALKAAGAIDGGA